MKTINDLTHKWWYRLLKVLYIVFYTLIAVAICVSFYEENEPIPTTSRVPITTEYQKPRTDDLSGRKSLEEIFGTQRYQVVENPVTDQQSQEATRELFKDLIVPMISLLVTAYLLNRAFKYIFLKERFLGDPDVWMIVITILGLVITTSYASMSYGG